jgi:parallel beta-helix repeat protein
MISIRFLISAILIATILIMSVGIGAANEVTLTLEGITADGLPNHAMDVCVTGNHAYVADYTNGLVIVDISDPANPTTVGNFPSRIGNFGYTAAAIGVAVSGNYAYVANWYDDLYIIDVTDKTNPTLANTYNIDDGADSITISGDLAFIAAAFAGVDIIDISDPVNPVFIGNYNTDDLAEDVAIQNNYAYIADRDDGVIIVDVSDLANPSFVGSCDTPYDANSIVVSGAYAYVADADDTLIIDISNQAAPVIVGQYDSGDAWGIALDGNYVYVGDGDNGVVVLNVNDPSNPVYAGSYDTAGYAGGLNIVSNLVYVADDSLVILRIDASSTSGPVHNINKGTHYTTIQAAIDDANLGDEIHVDAGTYVENVIVDKQLALIGEGADMVIVQAADSQDHVIEVTADWVNLSGFTVTGTQYSWNAGIYLNHSNYSYISDNNASNNDCGILIGHSFYNNLQRNIYFDNWVGISLQSSSYNILKSNNASRSDYFGIHLEHSPSNTIINNLAFSNVYGGISVGESSSENNLTGNTANLNDGDGIYIWRSNNCILINNNASSNSKIGIILEDANISTLANNIVENNYGGIYLNDSINNLIYHNNIKYNTNQANDDTAANSWDSGYPSGGNYWSDYIGNDDNKGLNQDQLGSDGIGDTPYPIPGGSSVDNYPLMNPWDSTPISGPVHNINKGTDYTTIQAAIDDASPGDEIHVDSGTYNENVDVNKRLTLIGDDADVVTVRAASSSDHVFEVTADYVNISGFTVTGTVYPDTGIYLGSSTDHCNISNNRASNNGYGLHLYSSNNNMLHNNNASNNNVGIYLDSSSNNILQNNNMSNRGSGILLYRSSNYNTLTNNTANSNDGNGIYLDSSSNNMLQNNNVSNNWYGIRLYPSSNYNTLQSNTVNSNNDVGISLYSSSNNILYHNNLIDNAHNAYDTGTNQWDSGSEGNHYGDDYTGTDGDGNGIGDTPYPIPGGSSVDNYPLMAPWDTAPTTGPVHNINKGTHYTTIQAAIDDASPGDEIHVDSGNYYENVVVNKQLILRGIDTGTGMPVIDAGSNGNVITLSIDGCLLDGFIITNSGLLEENAGIEITSNNNVIKNNEVFSNKWGIDLVSSNNNILKNNIVTFNSYPGIVLTSSNNNIISNNAVNSNGYYGIELYLSSNNTVIDNIANSNTRYGIFVWKSDNDNKIISNTANNNEYAGIRFYTSNNNEVSGNILELNIKYGISMYGSSGNIIFENNASFNENGIYLDSLSNNIIYHNNINKNTYQAFDNLGPNNWDNGYPSGGNYWSDYTGTDSDSDGIGDTPYPIPGGSSVDRYPLMAAYIPPSGPQDHSLVQVEGEPEVYWFQNNRLYWVTDWNVINDMSGVPGWSSVNTLPASEFNPADYPQGPRFITTGAESDGLLIRQVGDYKVYRIENGKKRHITYPDVMDLKGYSFDDVIEVSSEISDMFPLGDPIGIEVDLYFNKKTDSGDISHTSQFASGETVKSITATTVVEDYTVETYVRMIKPDGTEKYAYRERSDFLQTDDFQFSDTKKSLYPGTWHAQTKTWNWDEYTFAGDEMEGVYTWEFWYEDVASGKVLGKDVQGYEFTNTPPSPDDTIPPFILIISPIDGKTVFHSNLLIYGTAFDLSGIETLTVNGQDVISVQAFGVVPFYAYVDLNEGLNEITILAKDASENHNEKIEEITVNYYPFNVEITSPTDLDRFTPDDSISFRGEVGGGTPPFTYKWIIINDSDYRFEYPGTSDNGVIELTEDLESGNYEVKLEVIDHEGYSIEAKEIQIHVSRLNGVTTFLPNPNGYQFENFGKDEYSWDIFRITYGADKVEFPNGTRRYTAETFYEENYRYTGQNGVCFGMSASSLILYQNDLLSWDLAGQRSWINPGRDRSLDKADVCVDGIPLPPDYNDNGLCDPAPRTWGIFPSYINTPTEWVEYYHPLRYDAACYADDRTYTDLMAVYNELKLRMRPIKWKQDPMVIGYMYTDDKGEAAGHAVVPYRIEESENHKTGKIFIYDSGRPGDPNCNIMVNLTDWTGSYDSTDLRSFRAIRLSAVKSDPQLHDFESVTSFGHLLYTDAVGRHLGYYNGEFKDEIPDTSRIVHFGQTEGDQLSETYYISDLNLKRELYGLDDGIATVSIVRLNSLVVANVQVSPSSVDELRVPPNGSSVEFVSGEGTSTLSLMLDRENTDMARLARINISGIQSGNRLQLLFLGDNSNVSMKNQGSQKECNIYLEQIGFNGSYGYLRDIVIEENSSIRITPLDWNDINNNLIMIEHDIGNDGTIEYTETRPSLDIKPPSSITNLYSTPGTSWLNWTWTNPPDPDFNHTEIYLNGTVLTSIPAPQNYYNITGLLPDTPYELSTHTVDTSGNINETWVNATARTLPLPDTTPPIITFISPTDPNDTTLTTRNWTFINVSLSEPGYSWLEWNRINESMSGSGTHWYINKTGLVNGVYTYRVWVNDSAGNVNVSETRAIEIDYVTDTIPPVITITSPVNDTTYNTDSVDLNYSINEPTTWQGYSTDGAANITLLGNTTLTGFTDGLHILTVYANDTSGNMNSTTAWFTIDTTPPAGITNLQHTAGQTWIKWTWTNPPDPDFNHSEIYLNGTFQTNTSAEFFNATDLTAGTEYTISTRTVDINGNINLTWVNDTATTTDLYNITFLPPITTMDQFNLTNGRTLPIKFTSQDNDTGDFIYDDTVNVTIKNSTGHLITYFTYGTGTDSVRINTTEEQYIVNFHTRNYGLNVEETYAITVTFGEPDSPRGYEITYFTLVDKGKGKEK